MKKMFKSLLVSIIAVFTVILSSNISFAVEDDTKINLKLDNSPVEPEESFILMVEVDSTDGIIGMESKLEFDENVFILDKTVINSNWTNMSAGSIERLDGISTSDEKKKDGNVFEVYFQVKENVGSQNSEIKLKNIKYYIDDSMTKTLSDASVNVSIENKAKEINNGSNNNNNAGESNLDNTNTAKENENTKKEEEKNNQNENTAKSEEKKTEPTNTQKSEDKNNVNDTAKKELPKTGTNAVIICVVILAVTGLAVILYSQYRKYKEI